MEMNFGFFMSVIDGQQIIKVEDYNTRKLMYEGKKVDCPCFDIIVIGVWTDSNGTLIIAGC